MLSFRSSGSSKECMVGGSFEDVTNWSEAGTWEGEVVQLHCSLSFLFQLYPLKLLGAEE